MLAQQKKTGMPDIYSEQKRGMGVVCYCVLVENAYRAHLDAAARRAAQH